VNSSLATLQKVQVCDALHPLFLRHTTGTPAGHGIRDALILNVLLAPSATPIFYEFIVFSAIEILIG
jgi:hypothetical protein